MDDLDHIGLNDHSRPEPFEDFPREAIEDRLDGIEHAADNRQATALAVRRLIIFALGRMDESSMERIGLRTAALAYALDPRQFDRTPSLRRIAQQLIALKNGPSEERHEL